MAFRPAAGISRTAVRIRVPDRGRLRATGKHAISRATGDRGERHSHREQGSSLADTWLLEPRTAAGIVFGAGLPPSPRNTLRGSRRGVCDFRALSVRPARRSETACLVSGGWREPRAEDLFRTTRCGGPETHARLRPGRDRAAVRGEILYRGPSATTPHWARHSLRADIPTRRCDTSNDRRRTATESSLPSGRFTLARAAGSLRGAIWSGGWRWRRSPQTDGTPGRGGRRRGQDRAGAGAFRKSSDVPSRI